MSLSHDLYKVRTMDEKRRQECLDVKDKMDDDAFKQHVSDVLDTICDEILEKQVRNEHGGFSSKTYYLINRGNNFIQFFTGYLGTGQIQIRDIKYVELQKRSSWQFCQLLDAKYIRSARRSFDQWFALAIKCGWIKDEL